MVAFDDGGLRIHSADRTKQLKLRAYAMFDALALLGDSTPAPGSNLAVKRASVILDANLFSGVAARIMFEVGPSSASSPVQDAYVDAGLGGGWWMRAGKQKTPVGLERYISVATLLFPERSLASNLHASRDVGILVTGPVVTDAVEASLGVFDGAPDGGATQDGDATAAKDVTYRAWFKPYRHTVGGVEQGVGIAFNGSTGLERGVAGGPARLPRFKTQAAQTFFAYSEGQGVRAAGRHTRNGAFAYFHQGPFGAMAEWFANSQAVARGTSAATVRTNAWLVSAQYSLTGEPSGPDGLTPRKPFDPASGHWGAWQAGARVAALRVGDEAFPMYADSSASARGAVEAGAVLNWYLSRLIHLQAAYQQTTFTGGGRLGNRRPERLLQLRWQLFF